MNQQRDAGVHANAHRRIRETITWTCVVIGAAAYSWLASGTRPFTAQADIVTGTAFAAVTVVVLALRCARSDRVPAVRNETAVSPIPWAVAVGVLVASELITYLAFNRFTFPTLSSLYDEIAHVRVAKAASFFAWLVLGYALFAP